MLVCVFLCNFAHETAGAARTRLSLRPLAIEGGKSTQKLGCIAPRECEGVFDLNCHRPRKRTIQYSRDGGDGINSHGVLDPRVRGDDNCEWSGRVH